MDDAMTPAHRAALSRLRAGWGRMDGRTVLVTGATRGIGLETAVRLAGLGAEVLVHGRDAGRGAAALAAVGAASTVAAEGAASTERAAPALYLADLGSLAEIHRLTAELRRDRRRLDVLVANAGVYVPERQQTADGLELTFAVNVGGAARHGGRAPSAAARRLAGAGGDRQFGLALDRAHPLGRPAAGRAGRLRPARAPTTSPSWPP